MRSAISKTLHLLNRRSRSGQSIIIIALGFIGLVAFVGIATDTAILFVRYSTLHRAVDAAAIAAAGAARQSPSFAALGAVAEEYIQIHGLQPSSVRVDDCATEIDDYLNSIGVAETGPGTHTDAENLIGFNYLISQRTEQLCTVKPQKLVRVEAQIDSQTTFLSLIGFPTVRLSASSVSQTASLDVALLIDASSSESYDTRTDQRCVPLSNPCQALTQGQLDAFTPFLGYFDGSLKSPAVGPKLNAYDSTNPSGAVTGTNPYGSIRAECRQTADVQGSLAPQPAPSPHAITVSYQPTLANYYYGGCCNEPVTFTTPGTPDPNWYIYSDPTNPQYNTFNVGNLYSGQSPMDTGNPKTGGGFANRNYSTLVCKPFKYVRDAARDFLNHFDFNGGDRAMLVTYDDSVHELTSNGEYNNPSDSGAIGSAVPVFNTKSDAIIALNKYAGVEISPTGSNAACLSDFYPPYNTNGRYIGGSQQVNDTGNTWVYETLAACSDTNTGGAVLAGQSLLTNPTWIRRDSVWVMVILSDGYPNRTPGLSAVCAGANCNPAIAGGQSPSIHKINLPGDLSYGTSFFGDPAYMTSHSGNFFGQAGFPYPPSKTAWDPTSWTPCASPVLTPPGPCPGTGQQPISALSQASMQDPGFCPWATFCDPTGGGTLSAGTNYPLVFPNYPQVNFYYPNGFTYPDPANHLGQPGVPDATGNTPDLTAYNHSYCQAAEANPIWWAADSGNPGLQYSSNQNFGSDKVLCTSTNPDARHFCMNPTTGVIDPAVNGGPYPSSYNPALCSINYDSADYARDQVDFAALTDYTSTLKGNSVAMYGIFFPHQTNSVNGDIGAYILGAKFMRYVADAGDNGTIDNHVQAWYRQHIVVPATYQTDPIPPSYNGLDPAYGSKPEDPCAAYDFQENGGAGNPPGTHQGGAGLYAQFGQGYEDLYKYNCGNYYYAGSTAAVDQAFLSIAGRLFTRLAH